jgi:hypothetical protein
LEQAKKLKDLQKENAQLRRAVADLMAKKQILKDVAGGTSKSRAASPGRSARSGKGLSERRACQLVGQPRGTQGYPPTQRCDEAPLTQAMIALA